MPEKTVRPYGCWPSVVTAESLVTDKVGLEMLQTDGQYLYWLEIRPQEKGRCVIMRDNNGTHEECLPEPWSARSRVHEYGGGSFCADEKGLYFVNNADQQIWFTDRSDNIVQLTRNEQHRHADLHLSHDGKYLAAICEKHVPGASEPENTLVILDTDTGEVTDEAGGHDFFAFPAFNSDDTRLCWISWDHPDMPWDRTALWHAGFDTNTGKLEEPVCITGDAEEAVFEPRFTPDNSLLYVSDRHDWWNLYDSRNPQQALTTKNAEFAFPLWVFGMSTWIPLDDMRLACCYIENGTGRLGVVSRDTGALTELDLPFTAYRRPLWLNKRLYCLAASPVHFEQLIEIDPDSGEWRCIKASGESGLDDSAIATGQEVDYPVSGNQVAHGFYYPPTSPDYVAPENEQPPLIVMSHGGPTAFSDNTLSFKVQYWTSRGFAVLDVNYRGSTGYGRPYRRALDYQWGVHDVEDCEAGALYLAGQGLADPERLLIRGGSAGGYTTLAALAFRESFRAGASYYGISDLMILANDTHKFESRYLDRLIGPPDTSEDLYKQRSPINHVEGLNCPVIFFQGLQDKVVPPNQAELMVEALRKKKIPVAYVTYADEQHGFRNADAITHSIEAEYYFYCRVLGLESQGADCDTDTGTCARVTVDIDNL